MSNTKSLRDLYRQALQGAPSSFEAGELFRFVSGADPASPSLDAPATPEMQQELARLLQARTEGYPLQYLLGQWEFYSLPFLVGPGVLIPRQDTETLVDVALDILKHSGKENPELLDLCSGSGCIAIAIKHNFPGARVSALEASAKALAFLKKNAAANGADIICIHADLRDYESAHMFDMIVSNPPYIPCGELPSLQTEVQHEPVIALDGGEDGLDFYRAIAGRHKSKLVPGGVLLLEIGAGQEKDVADILTASGFADVSFHNDLNGIVRVLCAGV